MVIWVMIEKDLKRMIRDRKALLITILMPAILTTILGFSIGAFFTNEVQLDPAKIAVVSYANIEFDKGKFELFFQQDWLQAEDMVEVDPTEFNVEKVFIEEFLSNETIQEFIRYEQMTEEKAQKLLDDGELTAIIFIPEDFHYNLWISYFTPFRNDVEFFIKKNPQHELKAGIVEMIVRGFTDHISVGVIGKQLLLENAAEFQVGTEIYQELALFMENVMMMELDAISLERAAIEGKNPISSFHYYAAAMGVMFMLYSASHAASYTVNERFLLTYSRIKMAGVNLFSIMSGRFFSCSVFTFLQLSFLMLFSTFLFQISWGSYASVFPITVMASITVGTLAVLISIINLLASSDRASEVFQAAIIPLMAMIGGSFIPNGNLPAFLKMLGDNTVNGAVLNSYVMVMQGYQVQDVMTQLFVLVVYSFVFLSISIVLIRRKEV